MNITCDYCTHAFKLTVLEERKIHDTPVRQNYFTCPECHYKYHVSFTDSTARGMQKHLASLRRGLVECGANMTRWHKAKNRIESYEDKYAKYVTHLEEKYYEQR